MILSMKILWILQNNKEIRLKKYGHNVIIFWDVFRVKYDEEKETV